MTTLTPSPFSSQRRQALAMANAVRLARADVKRDLRAGRVDITTVLAEPPSCLRTAPILDVLLTIPGVGQHRAGKLLFRAQCSPTKTVGEMTDRQRRAIAEHLR